MALTGSAATWKTAIMATINTSGLNASEITTLETFWLGICQVHETHIITNASISTTVVVEGPLAGVGTGTPPATGIS